METITLLQDKHIILGVTGSIAAYKAVDLASKLTQAGAQVDVILTDAAQQFVAPITFQSVTGRPVYTSMWAGAAGGGLSTHIAHVGLGEGADLFIVAPVTANSIAKFATGLADNLLSVTALAARCPTVLAPAMDGGMYEHPTTQANLATLRKRGVTVIEPDIGRFASGLEGRGRFPTTPDVIGHIRRVLGQQGPLRGRKVVVTAGGTREPLDPVRFISNRSSGKQGYALAQAAVDAGAEVTLISTTSATLQTPVGVSLVAVNSAEEMRDAVLDRVASADALLMAAAVADFGPADVAQHKIKKSTGSDDTPTLLLRRTPDILLGVKQQRKRTNWPRVVVGFAAESQDLIANARDKLARKGADLFVANDISASDAGFGTDTNRVTLLDTDGNQRALELASKARVSEAVVNWVATRLKQRSD